MMVICPICRHFNAKNASPPAIGITTHSIIGPTKRSYGLAASSTVREADRSTGHGSQDSQVVNIIQLRNDALDISNTIIVGIFEAR
jgi:hypothetical protein